MSLAQQLVFDDVALDYSIGQVLEALSILEGRGQLPGWAGPYVMAVEGAFLSRSTLPPYVLQAVTLTCQEHEYTVPTITGGLYSVATEGTTGPLCTIRTLRTFLFGWRKQLRSLRPPPRFVQLPH